jgi:hypothetical protein
MKILATMQRGVKILKDSKGNRMIRGFLDYLNTLKRAKFIPVLFIFLLQATGIKATTYYVNAANPAPVAPYTSWLTAAANIQDAVSLTTTGDTVLVTNGIYAYGGLAIVGSLTNRVALTNAITVQSVNGPWVTTILGAGMTNGASAVRCAWLTNGASLVGFTLTAGATLNSGNLNTTESGGGVWCASTNAAVRNCVIVSNTAVELGAGVYLGTLSSCLLDNNTSSFPLGAASYQSALDNCTVVSNDCYGVFHPAAMTNCIIYYNGSPGIANYSIIANAFSHCCTTPSLPGPGNFTTAPNLSADGVHLANNSPCIGAGVNIGIATDIFGNSYSNPPSVGCAEWSPAPFVTTPRVKLTGSPAGFSVGNFTFTVSPNLSFGWLQNGVPLSDNGHFSGSQTTNLTAIGVSLADAGNYQVAVSNSFGMVTSSVATLVVHCVNVVGTNPTTPYLTWATAATRIQDAINASAAGDIVLVTNGNYPTGGLAISGTLTNRVVLNLPIMVMSVNGFQSTAIQGVWDPISTNGPNAVRCAWVGDGAVLNGFTLQNGATGTGGYIGGQQDSGGGVWCNSTNGIVSNCVLTNNAAIFGGGAANGTLDNSLIVNNQAEYGGGALDATLNNCTVINNQALTFGVGNGGGTYSTIVRNSIVLDNYDIITHSVDNYHLNDANLYYSSCSSPLSPFNNGNINTTDPKFLDLYHISMISPCYGAGNPAYTSGYDLDGEPWNNPPSMGCSEIVQSNLVGPLTVNCFAFLTNTLVNRSDFFFGSIQGRAAYVNWSFADGPVYTNFGCNSNHQWTNAGDYLVTLSAYNNDNPGGVSTNLLVHVQPIAAVQMQSTVMLTNGFSFQFAGQYQANYTILYSTNLAPPVAWQTLQTINFNFQTNIQILDPAAANATRYYRVSAQ